MPLTSNVYSSQIQSERLVTDRLPPAAPRVISDQGRVRLGAGMRRAAGPISIPTAIADVGKVRLGAGMRRR